MPNKTNRINPLDVAMKQVDIAAEKLKLDTGLGENIEQQERSQSCIFQPRWMVEALNFRRI